MIERHYFAGDTQLKARGRYFRYAASSGGASGLDERLTVVVDGHKAGVLLPGESIELDEAVDRWELFPHSAAPGEVEIGQGIVRSGRVMGMVESWPAGVRQVRQGRHHFNLDARTPGAGNVVIGVFASGGPVALHSFEVTLGATQNVRAWLAQGVPDVYSSLQGNWSRVAGEAASSRAFMMTAESSTSGVTAPDWGATTMSGWQHLGMVRLNANELRGLCVRPGRPLILPDGWGFYVVGQTATTFLCAEVDTEEL